MKSLNIISILFMLTILENILKTVSYFSFMALKTIWLGYLVNFSNDYVSIFEITNFQSQNFKELFVESFYFLTYNRM